ncbi:divergent PAP2 family protein [Paenibacillus sp. GCM10028914]|uniref:divergent PAP2 family protein n=1 Tax=Paenibacillus sp. GCM10028914 TaxID=3273416 RepID=UPI003623D8B3
MNSIWNNFPLIAALLSIILAQFVKVPIHFISHRSWNIKLAFSTGGMPSSHSAAVCSLSTAIALKDGLSSSSFAIAVILSAITMFDATGIRRHAGIHAKHINRLLKEGKPIKLDKSELDKPVETLKELLGHEPIEVFMGAVFGIVISYILYFSVY